MPEKVNNYTANEKDQNVVQEFEEIIKKKNKLLAWF